MNAEPECHHCQGFVYIRVVKKGSLLEVKCPKCWPASELVDRIEPAS